MNIFFFTLAQVPREVFNAPSLSLFERHLDNSLHNVF